jgi:hypothetical protein
MDYTKTNIKPPGTHNFMSVLDRDKIFQKPSYDYYKEAVSRRFGSQFYNFTSKFNIGGSDCIGHPGILQYLQELHPNLLRYEPLRGGLNSIKYISDG